MTLRLTQPPSDAYSIRVILLEHEAKGLLRSAGLNTPYSLLVSALEPSAWDSQKLPAVVKVQTPFGKRWQHGGIRFAETESELKRATSELLSASLNGYVVKQLLIEERIRFSQQLFISLSYDSRQRCPFLMMAVDGGTGIEELAASRPDAVWRLDLSPQREVLAHHLVEWLAGKGLTGAALRDLSQILRTLVRHFFLWDALLLEVNPLVLGDGDTYYALDCHLEIDDDALPRQRLGAVLGFDPARRELGNRRLTQFEADARAIDESDYRGVAGRLVEFPGTMGLLIGGGGASLTIFDAVLRHGGEPANYCEIGGNPTPEKIARLTELIVTQPKVKTLAVIMNVVNNTQADLVAEGVIRGVQAAGKIPAEAIVMFRLPGSGERRCREILSVHHVPFTDRSVTIDEAAMKAVEAARLARGPDTLA